VRGSFDDSLAAARELAARGTHTLVNSLNPYRLEGQKTAAFEIVEELGQPPDVLALPYGGGGNTCAYARGFEEAGAGLPRIVAVQASERAATAASAIRIAEPVHAQDVEQALARTGGSVVTVSDDAILDAWRILAHEEGLFCEPASAAGVAGLADAGLESGSRVVCVITGHGLKDPETAERVSPPPVTVDPDADSIAAAA
jgi:threonine synthase